MFTAERSDERGKKRKCKEIKRKHHSALLAVVCGKKCRRPKASAVSSQKQQKVKVSGARRARESNAKFGLCSVTGGRAGGGGVKRAKRAKSTPLASYSQAPRGVEGGRACQIVWKRSGGWLGGGGGGGVVVGYLAVRLSEGS